jgi:hypothetical protein
MVQKKKYDIFICYSRRDLDATKTLTNVLASNGYTYFLDVDGVSSGEDYIMSIVNAIESCSMFLFVQSNNSTNSSFCAKEIHLAESQGKPILTINIDNTPLTNDNELALLLRRDNSLSLHSPNFEIALLNIVGHYLGRINTVPLTQEQRNQNLEAAEERRNGSKNYIPQKIDVDIFISYRRVDGRDYARNIMQALKIMGYPKVFFDFNSLRDGVFNTQILDAIYSCKDFILVISPLALKNCGREGDWVTKEIREALKYNKKIIPIVIEDTFKDWPADFPEDLSSIKDIQFHKMLTDEYFEDSMEKLTTRLTTPASTNSASILDLKSLETAHQETIYYKIKVNRDCRLYIDDEEIESLIANRVSKIPLPKGEYIRKVVCVENNQIVDEAELILEQDKAELIYLKIPFWKRLMLAFHK